MNYPKRKKNRLENWDYSTKGSYFITICTHEKKCILSRIQGGDELSAPAVGLTEAGKIVDKEIKNLESRFENISLDFYIIMPNHVHLLLTLRGDESSGGASPSPTVTAVIGAMKSISTRRCHLELNLNPLWQRSFHDHIIRDERDYLKIAEYIENNPARWGDDCYAIKSE